MIINRTTMFSKVKNLVSSIFLQSGIEKITIDCHETNKINFDKLIANCNLPSIWKENNFFENEIKKSFLRGYIRENFSFKDKIKEVIEKSHKYKKISKKINFITKPYPIIHLVNDRSEVDKNNQCMHYDQIGTDPMITAWLPLTQYDYAGISYTKYGKIVDKFTKKIEKKIEKIFVENIQIQQNQALIWYGHLPHKGNLNTGKNISSAAVFWLTNKKIHDSKSIQLSEYLDLDFGEKNNNINFTDLFEEYKKIVASIIEIDNLTDLKKIAETISHLLSKKHISEKNIICFALSLLGQRCEGKEMFTNTAFNCHFVSDKVGDENLHSAKYLKSLIS